MEKTEKRLVFKTVSDFRNDLKRALDFARRDPDNEVLVQRGKESFLLFVEDPNEP